MLCTVYRTSLNLARQCFRESSRRIDILEERWYNVLEGCISKKQIVTDDKAPASSRRATWPSDGSLYGMPNEFGGTLCSSIWRGLSWNHNMRRRTRQSPDRSAARWSDRRTSRDPLDVLESRHMSIILLWTWFLPSSGEWVSAGSMSCRSPDIVSSPIHPMFCPCMHRVRAGAPTQIENGKAVSQD